MQKYGMVLLDRTAFACQRIHVLYTLHTNLSIPLSCVYASLVCMSFIHKYVNLGIIMQES